MIILCYNQVFMIDFTTWYFVFKHFKLQEFNTIAFFLSFVQSEPNAFHLLWLPQIHV